MSILKVILWHVASIALGVFIFIASYGAYHEAGEHLTAASVHVSGWCRVKDIYVRSWLGQEYRRLRWDAVELSREQSYGIFQDALRNYARWVEGAAGVEVWLPEN